MWSSVSSYFTNFSANHLGDNSSDSDESDWVFVNSSGDEVSRKEVSIQEDDVKDPAGEERKSRSITLSPSHQVDLKNRLCTPQISPAISPSRMDGSWFITPPPCFTVKCSSEIEKSPLEDLLIEHPSMSVYSVFQSEHRPHLILRVDEHLFQQELQDQHTLQIQKQTGAIAKENNNCGPFTADHTLPHLILSDKNHHRLDIQQKKSGARDSTKKVTFGHKPVKILSSLENCAIPVHCGKLCEIFPEKSKASVPKKQLLPKKGNKKVTKPSNLVKWGYEQRNNLRSSYITRQNRVHQSRNRFCQRNSHVVKPFGEKCKHQF